jgi:hypothetical protein
MSQSARVTSFEAVKDFQAALATFCEAACDALASIEMEARRIHEWVLHDQLHFWRRQVIERQEEVAEAKAALFRRQLARISGHDPDCIEQKEAVWAAQRRVEEAEDKVEKCRQWGRLLQRAREEYQAPARQLAALVEGQPPPSVVVLGQIIDRLDAYVAVGGAPAPEVPALKAASSGVQDKPSS